MNGIMRHHYLQILLAIYIVGRVLSAQPNFLLDIPLSVCTSIRVPKNETRMTNYLLNEKKKIIMGWTPKAACTKMVEMFWDEMNITRGVFYPENAFIHPYRVPFYKQCGLPTTLQIDDPGYYTFKVVRNPYFRVVSSYLHVMKTKISHHLLSKSPNSDHVKSAGEHHEFLKNASFEAYLAFYLEHVREYKPALESHNYYNAAISHFESQSDSEEYRRFSLGQPSYLRRVVHLENFDAEIALVNRDTSMNFSYPVGKDSHVVHKYVTADEYVGNRSYPDLIVPENYGQFYNRRTMRLVNFLFSRDILLYSYSFPFEKLYD